VPTSDSQFRTGGVKPLLRRRAPSLRLSAEKAARLTDPARRTTDHLSVPVSAPANALAGLPPALFSFDDFELDEVRFEFRASGEVVPMEPQVFDLLRYMVRNEDRVLTKDELLDAIWPERYVTEAALNSRIMSARKAIRDDGRQQRYIKTVHGRGYRFIATVTCPADGALASATTLPPSSPRTPDEWHTPLPAPSTSFIGRGTELARIQDLLEEGRSLVSIVGPGGIGKTRLAIEAATNARATGRPVVYVSLEPLADAAHLPGAIAAAIGLKPSTTDTAAEVLRYLAGSRLLLVLDNFEERVPDGVPFVSELLAAAPQVQVLVTSRVVLGLVEEWAFRVEGLSLVRGTSCTDAMKLFLERASQANAAAPAPSDDDCGAIAEIVQLVDGMPLAIELAAALTRYLPYREVAALLIHDTACLASDQQNATPRHRNMRSLLEESCRHLEPVQLRALHSLGVFDGPFAASAAAHVCGASLLLLRQLVDRSLVQPVNGRFALHPLMRQFARERCGGDLEELRRRHAEHYASFLADRRDSLHGPGQVDATREMEAEFTNAAAAWRWAAANDRVDLLDAAMYPLFCHLTFRARFFEADELAAVAIRTVEEAGEGHAGTLGSLLLHHFWVLSRLGRLRESLSTLRRANDLFSSGRQPRPGLGMDQLTAVAAVQIVGGDYSEAAPAALAALESAQAHGDQMATAFAAWLAGVARLREARLDLHFTNGRFGYRPAADDAALQDATRLNALASSILESAGETWLRAYVEIERGLIAKAHGDTDAGVAHFRTACELRRSIGDRQGTASALIYLCDSVLDLQDLEETSALHAEAMDHFAAIGDATGLAEAERFSGRLALARGDIAAAQASFMRTIEQSVAIGFTNNALSALRGLAQILQRSGCHQESAVVHAFVADHPAATPFTRAGAVYDLALISSEIGPAAVEEARVQASDMDLRGAAAFAMAAIEAR
jgi:predicted ATPase/DNA-binding winged helix-turn-helix (wHTH) protein